MRTCLFYSQYHGCWWLGDTNSQRISNHGIELVLLEYSGLSTRRVKKKKGDNTTHLHWCWAFNSSTYFRMHCKKYYLLTYSPTLDILWQYFPGQWVKHPWWIGINNSQDSTKTCTRTKTKQNTTRQCMFCGICCNSVPTQIARFMWISVWPMKHTLACVMLLHAS